MDGATSGAKQVLAGDHMARPLIPKTAGTAATTAFIGAVLLSLIGWFAVEFIEVGKRLARIEARQDDAILRLIDDYDDLEKEVDTLTHRLVVMEERGTNGSARSGN